MFKNKWRLIGRNLHVTSALRGSQLREKLRSFERSNLVLRKSSKELARINEKKFMKRKKLRKTAYSKQQALHLLNKDRAKENEEAGEVELGPTSQSDLKFMSTTRDRRMLYTILGINGEQLRDSKLIKEDTEKFLKRGQVEKAVFLARLAKTKGSAAMNSIMEYYFYELKYPQSAIKMYNWRKKWGVPANKYTNTILFNGLARQSQHVSKSTGDLVMKVVNRSIALEELSQIEFNAALGALANCTDVTLAFDLFDRKLKGIRYDAISYMWMLRACSRVKTDKLFNEILGGLIAGMPAKSVDSQLLFEFCRTLASRSENAETRNLALVALNRYFSFNIEDSSLLEIPDGLAIPPLSHWSLEKRFPLSRHTVGLFLNTCLQGGRFDLGIKAFLASKESEPKLIDIDMFHKYMELLMKDDPKRCGEKCLKVFEEMDSLGNIPFSKHTLILVYRSFEIQSLKKATNDNESEVEKLLATCRAFSQDQEGVFSKEFKSKVIPIESWQFLVKTVKNLNTHDKISTIGLKMIIDDFAKSVCHGTFDVSCIAKKEVARFIELEMVRLLGVFNERLKVPEIDQIDLNEEGQQRDMFLLRRLSFRFKNTLLKHIELLETKKRENEGEDELEWSMKQLGRKIITNKTLNVS